MARVVGSLDALDTVVISSKACHWSYRVITKWLSNAQRGVASAYRQFRETPNRTELLAVALVYLVQGVTDLAVLAQRYLLKDDLHASPAEVSYFVSAAGIPWTIKPLIGFVSDTVPLWGYRRKSYLVAAGLCGALGWLLLSVAAHSPLSALGLMTLTSAASAVSDVVVDSLVVERARREQQSDSGSLQSLCWASYAVGQVGSAYFSGALVEKLGPRRVFLLTALLPLLVVLVGLKIKENRGPGVLQKLRSLWWYDDVCNGADVQPAPASADPALEGVTPINPGETAAAAVAAAAAGGVPDARLAGREGLHHEADVAGGIGNGGGGLAAGGPGATDPRVHLGHFDGSDSPTTGHLGRGEDGPAGHLHHRRRRRGWLGGLGLTSSPHAAEEEEELLPLRGALLGDSVPEEVSADPAAAGVSAAKGKTPSDAHGRHALGHGHVQGSPKAFGGMMAASAAAAPPFAAAPGKVSDGGASSDEEEDGDDGGGYDTKPRRGLRSDARSEEKLPLMAVRFTQDGEVLREPDCGGSAYDADTSKAHCTASVTAGSGGGGGGGDRVSSAFARLAGVAWLMFGGLRATAGQLWATVRRREVAAPILFLFLSSATPAADDAMFFFMTGELGFTATFLGDVQLAVAIAMLVGVGIYHAFLRRAPLRAVLFWGTVLAALCQSSSLVLATRANLALGLDDHLFALGDSVMVSVIQYVLFMPTMVLSARICPPGMEATLFATIMSIFNIAEGLRYMLGGALMQLLGVTSTDFRHLPLLLAACSFSLLLPLPLLVLVPRSLDKDKEEEGTTAETGTAGGEGGGGGDEGNEGPSGKEDDGAAVLAAGGSGRAPEDVEEGRRGGCVALNSRGAAARMELECGEWRRQQQRGRCAGDDDEADAPGEPLLGSAH